MLSRDAPHHSSKTRYDASLSTRDASLDRRQRVFTAGVLRQSMKTPLVLYGAG